MTETLTELIRRTTSDLPPDVEACLRQGRSCEKEGSRAALMLDEIISNLEIARSESLPMCQDTGTLTFFFSIPEGQDTAALERAACEAVRVATGKGLLRKNTIDSITGASVDSNVAEGTPTCVFKQHEMKFVEVCLMQKGGGCENVSSQFSLPDAELGAGRDLDGVRACILKGVHLAQGYGCAPGILGVCIGSDRAGGYRIAKEQLIRPLDDESDEPVLAELEKSIVEDANRLGIGPMGLGGRTTLLGAKITARTRLPASFFVTVAYMCWACRRGGVRISPDGEVEWL